MSNTDISNVLGIIEYDLGTWPHDVATNIAIQAAIDRKDYPVLLLYLNLYLTWVKKARVFQLASSFFQFVKTIEEARDQVAVLIAQDNKDIVDTTK